MLGINRDIYAADMVTTIIIILGFLSIIYAPENIMLSSVLITIAGILDAVDGLIARRFASSDSGLVYDSIADIVSFSLSPAVIVYYQLGGMEIASIVVSTVLLLSTAVHMRRFMHTEKLLGCPTTTSALAVCQSVLLGSNYLVVITVTAFSVMILRKTVYTKDVDLKIKLVCGLIIFLSAILSYQNFSYDFLIQAFSMLILTTYGVVGGRVKSVSFF